MTNGNRTTTAPGRSGQPALKYELEVQDHGHLELEVPLAPGAKVVVFVVPDAEVPTDDFLAAAESSLSFWDNALDDEDWNGA